MVECFDRIHLRLAEVVLKPLQDLQADPRLTLVSVRPPGRGPRVSVIVAKCWPDGPDQPASYHWTAREIDVSGADLPGGRAWSDDRPHATAIGAYWAAIDTVAASRAPRSRAPVGGVSVSP